MSKKKSQDTKRLLILIGVVIGIFILFFAGFRLTLYLRGSTGKVVTIDEMHQLNLEGKGEEMDYVYNGFSFIYSNGAWYTQAQRGDTVYDIPLHFGPRDVENISVKGSIDPAFGNNRIVYVSFDPSDPYVGLAAIELSLNLGKGLDVATKSACDKDYDIDACKERSVVTCSDVNKSVVLIRQADETKVTLNGKCIIIEGRDKELMRAVDNAILRFYGILQG